MQNRENTNKAGKLQVVLTSTIIVNQEHGAQLSHVGVLY